MTTFEDDVAAALEYHGHLCTGMVHGIRMARRACELLGIEDPRSERDLAAIVEMGRCPADAVYAVTGLTVGRRRLKVVDYGKNAITMFDLASGRGFRLHPRGDRPSHPDGADLIEFYSAYADDELYEVQQVRVDVPPQDLPGWPLSAVACARCRETVLDRREVVVDGATLCVACAEGRAYYEVVGP